MKVLQGILLKLLRVTWKKGWKKSIQIKVTFNLSASFSAERWKPSTCPQEELSMMGQRHQKGQDSTWGGLRGKLASESADVLTLPQVQEAGKKDGHSTSLDPPQGCSLCQHPEKRTQVLNRSACVWNIHCAWMNHHLEPKLSKLRTEGPVTAA